MSVEIDIYPGGVSVSPVTFVTEVTIEATPVEVAVAGESLAIAINPTVLQVQLSQTRIEVDILPPASTISDFTTAARAAFSAGTGIDITSGVISATSGGVTSVNGQTGVVVLDSDDIAEGAGNVYYTDVRVSANSDVAANTAARHDAVTLGTANGLSLSGQELSLAVASASDTGALSNSDWTTFNNKQDTLTFGDIDGTVNQVSVSGGTDAIIGSGVTLSLPQDIDSGASVVFGNITAGNLSGTNTGDQTITLTGDVTGSATGSFATTIANGSVGLTSKVSGVLPEANGGTNISSYAQGDIIYASATNTLTRLLKSTVATRYLGNTGGGNNSPQWTAIDLSNGVTNALPATNGGTGQTSYAVGDILYASSTTALSKLASAGGDLVLITPAGGGAPEWGTVDLSGGGVAGTLGGGNGGTGTTGFGAANRIPYSTSTTALTTSANLTFNGSTFAVQTSAGSLTTAAFGGASASLTSSGALKLAATGANQIYLTTNSVDHWLVQSTGALDMTKTLTSSLTSSTIALTHTAASFGVSLNGDFIDITTNANAAASYGHRVEMTNTGGSGATGQGYFGVVNGSALGNAVNGVCGASTATNAAGVYVAYGSIDTAAVSNVLPTGKWALAGYGQSVFLQNTLGALVSKCQTIATNDDPTLDLYQQRVTTTNATVTTLLTYAVTASTAYCANIRILARRTGGSAGASGDYAVYEGTVAFRNEGGTVTVNGGAGAVSLTAIYENQAAWAADVIQSGTNILVRGTGAANNNVTWHVVKFEVSPLSS